MEKWKWEYLESFDFSFLCTQSLLPSRLCFGEYFHTRFELVNLLPPRLELFPHLVQFLTVPRFGVFASFVKVELDLREGFETRDEVIMEDTKVGERFRLGLTVFLLSYIIHRQQNNDKNE